MADDSRHLHIRFFHDAILDQGKSEAAGRKIYTDVEMIEVRFPGDNSRTWTAPAHQPVFMNRPKPGEDHDKWFQTPAEKYADAYKAFKEKNGAGHRAGTPLDNLPSLTEARIHELRAISVHTVEALANLGEAAISKYHLRSLVEQAKVWLGNTEAAAEVARIAAEKQAMEDRFAALEAKLAAYEAGGKPESDDPEKWDEDKLRDYLVSNGVSPRANAARDKLVQAVREMMQGMVA